MDILDTKFKQNDGIKHQEERFEKLIKISKAWKMDKVQVETFKSPFLEKYKRQRMQVYGDRIANGLENSDDDDDLDEVIRNELNDQKYNRELSWEMQSS